MKKLISLFMAAVMMFSLTACAPAVEKPEDLLTAAKEQLETAEAMSLKVEFELSAEGSLGSSTTMSASIDGHADITKDKDISFCEGMIGIDVLGINTKIPVKQYIVDKGEESLVYDYVAKDEEWIVATVKSEELDNFDVVELNVEDFTELTLDKEINKGFYTVTGKIPADKFMAKEETNGTTNLAVAVDDAPQRAAEEDISEEVIDELKGEELLVTMLFDKKDNSLKKIEITADIEDMENVVVFCTVDILHLGESKGFGVPQEIIDAAKEKKSGFDFSFTI